MKNAAIGWAVFLVGATVGAVASWFFLKEKYEEIAENEIKEVRDYYRKKDNNPELEETEETFYEKEHAFNMEEYRNIISKESYTNYSNFEKSDGKILGTEHPYIIPPEEFGELYDYEQISLTYYIDGVLADDLNEIVDDVEGCVGVESLTHFGEYEADSIFVRNDVRKADYEVLLDDREFADVVKNDPFPR